MLTINGEIFAQNDADRINTNTEHAERLRAIFRTVGYRNKIFLRYWKLRNDDGAGQIIINSGNYFATGVSSFYVP